MPLNTKRIAFALYSVMNNAALLQNKLIFEFSILNQLHTLLPKARFLESNVCDFQLQKVYGAKIQTYVLKEPEPE